MIHFHFLTGGTTLHSGLDFKFGTEHRALNRKSLDQLRLILQDLELIIIDEFSMVSSDMLYKIHDRLCEIFYPSQDYFGGKSIMFVGDIMQLKPVRGRFIFQEPKSKKYAKVHQIDPLWETFEVVVLETNHRQGDGNIWSILLSRARVGKLNDDDKMQLELRKNYNFKHRNTNQDFHIFYPNKEVYAQNSKVLHSLKAPLVEIKASLDYPRGYTPQISDWGTIDNSQFMKTLQIKVGAKVMVVFNINIIDSLVNGCLGVVTKIVQENNVVKGIIIDFDNPEVGLEQRKSNQAFLEKYGIVSSGVPIFRQKFEYPLPFRSGTKSHSCKGKINQFALKLAFAATSHKVQGISVGKDSTLNIHGHKRLQPGMGYVMLSRCADINSVYIDDEFDFEMIKCDEDALEEKKRLDERSIVQKFKSETYDLYMVNVDGKCKEWLADLEADIYAKKSNVVAVVETWLGPSEVINSTLGEFFGASIGNGKGCGVFLPPNTNFNKKSTIEENFQIISVQVSADVQIIVAYISSVEKNSKEHFTRVKCAIEDHLTASKCYVIGDFNFKSYEKNVLSDFLVEKSFVQLINVPTHIKGNTIDHLYVPKDLQEKTTVKIAYPYFSDHAALCVKFHE